MIAAASKKIKDQAALIKIVKACKDKGKKVVHCHGVFDIVHLGHIRHLDRAKKEGDVLIVTVTSDKFVKRGPGRPLFNEKLRAETIAALNVSDYVSIIDERTAMNFIKAVKPDVYAKGIDYKSKGKDESGFIYREQDAIEAVGGRIFFTEDVSYNTTSIINQHLDAFPSRTQKYLKAINKRYSLNKIKKSIRDLEKLKVLIIGDAIIDEYHYCTPMGKSSKEHLVANKYQSEEMFAGGSLATANNVASVCGDVDLLTVLGKKDDRQEFIESKLKENVTPYFFKRKDAETVIKRRYVNAGQRRKLFEICFMEDTDIEKETEKEILDFLRKKLKKYDLVVVNDFGHGLMTKKIINYVSKHAKYLALNVQTNSANTGYNLVTKYPSADCVCIDEMELRFAAHNKFGEVRKLAKQILNEIECKHIIATRGSYGSICYSKQDGYHETPAFADNVVDAIGAGDAFFAFVSPSFASGMPQELVSFVGNVAGSLAVQIVGNRESISSTDLIKYITRLLQ